MALEMDYASAKQYVKDNLEDYLERKGINTRSNFNCLNPEHEDSKPSMSIDRTNGEKHCYCFGCGAHYDTFDLIGIEYGLTDGGDIFRKGFELYGIQITGSGNPQRGKSSGEHRSKPTTPPPAQPLPAKQEIGELKDTPKLDFTAAIEAAHKELLQTPEALEYLQGRGYSMELIDAYKIGYDGKGHNHILKDFPENQSKSTKAWMYRYVYPYINEDGKCSYFITEIADRSQVDDYNGKYRKLNKGKTPETAIAAELFNERYLMKDTPGVVFVCEGIPDALSVEEAGGKAIAFVGTAHKRFLEICKKYKPDTTFVISLDNDQAGSDAAHRVTKGLDALNIPYIVKTADQGKDFNEALQQDRGAFVESIQNTIEEVEESKRAAEEAEREAYLQTSTVYRLQDFIDDIEKSKTATYYPTGFPSLDKLLDGGFYSGLYILGAVTALGKTTFALQVMDFLAESGQDVIIFSLEMARKELIAKSASRHSLQESLKRYQTEMYAKNMRGITTGSRYKYYTDKDREIIIAAIQAYSQYAEHIYIHEGVGDIGVTKVREVVEQHIRVTGNRPAILLDYIQILAPYNERATDKQNTDKAVLELKRLSRDYDIPVIGISSFNRDNYTAPVNLAAYKESGAVEYSSDVLVALQYEGMDYVEGEGDAARKKRVRALLDYQTKLGKLGKAQTVQVKILKNRNGSRGDTVLEFFPMYNYFCEKGESGIPGALATDFEV